MPTIKASKEYMQRKLKADVNEILEKAFLYAKAEGEEKDEYIEFEVGDTNRPDLWSQQGLVRALKPFFGIEEGLPKYKFSKPKVSINVDRKVRRIRPYIKAIVVRNACFDLENLVHVQSKLDESFGRKRKKVSIGLYDASKLKTLRYTTLPPSKIKFVPLGCDEEMNAKEILKKHEKGIAYGHLIASSKEWPVLIQGDEIISMPPIINAAEYSLTEKTKDVLIEATGTDENAVELATIVLATAIAEDGGKLEQVKIAGVDFPTNVNERMRVKLEYIDRMLGLGLTKPEITDALLKMRYGVRWYKDEVEVTIPIYRRDIMHAVDVIEDIAIGYGYDRITPLPLEDFSEGALLPRTKFINLVREIMIGSGAQEVLNFILSDEETQMKRCLKLSNPITKRFSCVRAWLLPGILAFLANNKTREYPQKVFEVGICYDKGEKHKLCFAYASSDATYTLGRQHLEALLRNLGMKFKLKESNHEFLIPGRQVDVFVKGKKVGFLGEVHPALLEKFDLQMPVVVFELNLEEVK